MNRHSKRCSRSGAVVVAAIADDHPSLVGRRADPERAERQRVERSRHRTVGSPAPLALAAAAHGIGDRYAVPFDQLDAFDEAGVGDQLADHLGDDEARRGVGAELLDEERQPGRRAGQRRRCDVGSVRVAEVDEDAGDLAVEGIVRHQPGAFVESAQLLHRIDAVHRPLQRQVDVQPVEQVGEHRDDVVALGLASAVRGGGALATASAQLRPMHRVVHGSTASSAKS